jgi:hypothetical protein
LINRIVPDYNQPLHGTKHKRFISTAVVVGLCKVLQFLRIGNQFDLPDCTLTLPITAAKRTQLNGKDPDRKAGASDALIGGALPIEPYFNLFCLPSDTGHSADDNSLESSSSSIVENVCRGG